MQYDECTVYHITRNTTNSTNYVPSSTTSNTTVPTVPAEPVEAAVATAEPAEAAVATADPVAEVPQMFIIDGRTFPHLQGHTLNTFLHADNFLESCCEYTGAVIITGVLDGNVRVDIYGRYSVSTPLTTHHIPPTTHHSTLTTHYLLYSHAVIQTAWLFVQRHLNGMPIAWSETPTLSMRLGMSRVPLGLGDTVRSALPSMPLLGASLHNLKGISALEVVSMALLAGCRLIDTARALRNEEHVGAAIEVTDTPTHRRTYTLIFTTNPPF